MPTLAGCKSSEFQIQGGIDAIQCSRSSRCVCNKVATYEAEPLIGTIWHRRDGTSFRANLNSQLQVIWCSNASVAGSTKTDLFPTVVEVPSHPFLSYQPRHMPPRENPPHPFALIEAMRSIGYTPATALADLVDNSVSAHATLVKIRVAPPTTEQAGGTATVEDNGNGMAPERLAEAMRWGGEGPNKVRSADDLGRFGLGMKTASISMGKKLTVATRAKPGAAIAILRWDLDHVTKYGWQMLDGPDQLAEPEIARSIIGQDPQATGTTVVVSELDRLEVRSALQSQREKNQAALTRKIATHLGMVFHRFLENKKVIRLGESAISPWDPFESAAHLDTEQLADGVRVSSFVLPHHSNVLDDVYKRLSGPLGWTAHQGFFVYRADRLIVPGGWLRLVSPEESCKLARIKIDLPNTLDAGWKLNVMKSSLAPPSSQLAALERIGDATRRRAMAVYSFRGERQAPASASGVESNSTFFWNQETASETVHFRINRNHPVVQTLKQSVKEPAIAEAFLRAFERLLPLEAILQDPKRTTNGAVPSNSPEDIQKLAKLAKMAVRVLRTQGHSHDDAIKLVLAADPFSWQSAAIYPLLK